MLERGLNRFSSSGEAGIGAVGFVLSVITLVVVLMAEIRLISPLRFLTVRAPLLKMTVDAPFRDTNKSNCVTLTPIVAVGVLIS